MTINGRVDIEHGVAILVVEEPWAIAELKRFLETMSVNPGFDPAMGVLLDVTRVQSVPASAEIEQYMAFLGSQGDRRDVKRAILVANDLQYGMGRMAAAYGEHYSLRVRVYRDLEAALAWLGGAA